MDSIVTSFWDWVKSGIVAALNLLPNTPFNIEVPDQVHDILGYVNYFVPIGNFVKILAAWTTCVSFYYIAMAFLRWMKIID